MQLEEAERRLHDSQCKLARLRGQRQSQGSLENGAKNVKVERRSSSPVHINRSSSRNQPQSKPELLIPAVNPKLSQPMKSSNSSGTQATSSVSTQSNSAMKVKGEKPSRVSSELEDVEIHDKGTKRKLGETCLLNSFALSVFHFVFVRMASYKFFTFFYMTCCSVPAIQDSLCLR